MPIMMTARQFRLENMIVVKDNLGFVLKDDSNIRRADSRYGLLGALNCDCGEQ